MIYLDCDGVLADFDRGAGEVLGMLPSEFEARFGSEEFWKRISETPDFFADLEPMVDAFVLYEAVRHTNPAILTGVPRGGWSEIPKRQWAERYFPGVLVITCFSAHKHHYRKAGDVLIDDRDRYRDRWEMNGGIFIHHISAEDSIDQLFDREILP